MIRQKLWPVAAVLLPLTVAAASAQSISLKPSELPSFMGTWVFTMTNPNGSEQTVRIWDKNGSVSASLQVGRFPPNDITGILKDGDVLVLSTTLRENGAPTWAVIALTFDGQTMTMAQMLQMTQARREMQDGRPPCGEIKRGTAHKQPD